MSHYQTLGVAKTASKAAVRAAYISLAKKFHPDVCKAVDARQKFQAIQEAYGILGDEGKRREYDLGGAGGFTETSQKWENVRNPGFSKKPGNSYSPPPPPPRNFADFAGFPGGAEAFWRYQVRTHQEEVEREFRRMQYEAEQAEKEIRGMSVSGGIISTVLGVAAIPFLLLGGLVWWLGKWGALEKGEGEIKVYWDENGRAFIQNAFGEIVRFEGYDLPRK